MVTIIKTSNWNGKINKLIMNHKIIRLIFSHFCYAFFYGIFLFCYEIRFVQVKISMLHPIFIIWGFLLIGYNILVLHVSEKIPYYKIMLLFVISTFFTALMNYQAGLLENIKIWVLVLIPILVIFPGYIVEKENKKNYIIPFLGAELIIFIASCFSLYLFFIRFGREVEFLGQKLFMGILPSYGDGGSFYIVLQGIYYDSGHAATYAVVSICISLIVTEFCRNNMEKGDVLCIICKFLNILNIIVQLCYFTLANSRGGWVSFFVSLFSGVYMFCFFKLLPTDKRTKKYILAFVIALFCTICFLFTLINIRNCISRISFNMEKIENSEIASEDRNKETVLKKDKKLEDTDEYSGVSEVEIQEEPLEKRTNSVEEQKETEIHPNENPTVDSFERPDESGESIGSGRLGIWKEAIELYINKPIFGENPGNNAYYANKYGVEGVLENGKAIHNSYLDLLVDYGLVGFLLLIGLYILYARRVLIKLIKKGTECNNSFFFAIVGIVLTMCSSFFLSSMFVNTTAMYFLNMLLLGYLVSESSLNNFLLNQTENE